jgi:hypothetical protein
MLQVGFAKGAYTSSPLHHLHGIEQKLKWLIRLAAADAYNPTLEYLDKRLSKYINGNPIRVDGRPRASGILDTVSATVPSLYG